MENYSNCSSSEPGTFRTTGFLAFSIVMLVTAVAAVIVVVLSTRQKVFVPIWIILVNLLVGAMFTAVAVVMQNTDSAILVAASNTTPVMPVCWVYAFFFRSSAAARLCILAAYSIAVLRVVIKGKNHLKLVHAILPVVIVWLFAMLLSVHWLVPSASSYKYIDGVRCTTHFNESDANLETALLTLWINCFRRCSSNDYM